METLVEVEEPTKTEVEVEGQIGSGWGAAWSLMPWAEPLAKVWRFAGTLNSALIEKG